MQDSTVFDSLGLDARDDIAQRLLGLAGEPDRTPVPADWRRLAAGLARAVVPQADGPPGALPRWDTMDGPLLLGLSGGQGAGKSTLGRQLQRALEVAGARVVVCSLDDFYLSRGERAELGRTVHPLLATRGVPGTHDLPLLRRSLDALAKRQTVTLPVFDKGADDRVPVDGWHEVTGPVDVVVLEGWCLGAGAESSAALREPRNALEAEEDTGGVWRTYVNAALAGDYAALWARLHGLVFLEVPDLAAVIRWRTEQEQALPVGRRMDAAAVARFVAHYERITRHMLATLPRTADVVVQLDARHAMAGIVVNRAT